MNDILLTESEVFSAMRLLFASDGRIDPALLQSIEQSQVKTAYRKKALETHPDRFPQCGGRHHAHCSKRFIEVTRAYETLNSYLDQRSRGFEFPRPEVKTRPNFRSSHQPHRRPARPSGPTRSRTSERSERSSSRPSWTGLPQRPLRIGEFLYHAGVISWRSLISALVWQRKQRPRLGEIAQKWQWLTEAQIIILLENRHLGERLGELMVRHKFINPFQLDVLIYHQRKLQQPIGHFFATQGLVTEAEIRRYLMRLRDHNHKWCPDYSPYMKHGASR
jgi:hypothetical protein